MTAPTCCPPYGLCVPVRYERARDGDTIEVRLKGGAMVWAVRLLDCWCPETKKGDAEERRLGKEALEYARQVLDGADTGDLRWWIPFSGLEEGVRDLNILKYLSFDRVLGYLYVGPSMTLNRMLVNAGLASTTKGGELGR